MVIGNIKHHQPISLSSNGSIIRDFIYIDNVAIAFEFCIENQDIESIVNVSSGQGRSLSEVIDSISCLSKGNLETVSHPKLPTDIVCSILSPNVLLKHLPKWPITSFNDGLKSTLRHFSLYTSPLS